MATSPNYNWPEPDNTDLVKNGALAIRTAVNAIDTSLAELKGGTTGQVLSKASNTDLDYTWVVQDDSNAIQNAIVDAKGDLIAATAADTPARLAVGTNGQVLTADSTTATGLKWAAPAGGGKVLQVVSTTKTDTFTSTSTTNVDITGLSATITPSSATSTILVMLNLTGSGIPAASYMTYQLVRNSTAIAIGDASSSRTRASNTIYGAVTGVLGSASNTFLDSPSTTSATTYKIQGRINTSGTFYVNRADTDTDLSTFARTVSSITLMEIGA
jgi:hypothetical protein